MNSLILLAIPSLLSSMVVDPTAHLVVEDAVGTPCALRIHGRVLRGGGDRANARGAVRMADLAARVTADGLSFASVELQVAGQRLRVRATEQGDFSALVQSPGCALGTGLVGVRARLVDRPWERAESAHAFALLLDPSVQELAVSDLDDTLLATDVRNPLSAAEHTLVESPVDRRPVVGAPAALTALTRRGVPVVYLSASPEILRVDTRRFLATHAFPPGVVLLRDEIFRPLKDYKRDRLDLLASLAPSARFLLLGDDGQQDPEIYDQFMTRHSNPARAYIHVVGKGRKLPSHGGRITSFGTFLDVQPELASSWDGERAPR